MSVHACVCVCNSMLQRQFFLFLYNIDTILMKYHYSNVDTIFSTLVKIVLSFSILVMLHLDDYIESVD